VSGSRHVASLNLMQLKTGRMRETRSGVEDPDELFGAVFRTAPGKSIAVDSGHRQTFVAICAAVWNLVLCESVCSQLFD
jgi:hypothetical protein